MIMFCYNLKTYLKLSFLKQLDVSFTHFHNNYVFGNFVKRVPAHVNQERKTVNNSLFLHYSAGSTFSTDSHKKTPENCGGYPQILNGERWEVSTLKVKTRLQLSFGSLAVGIVIQQI